MRFFSEGSRQPSAGIFPNEQYFTSFCSSLSPGPTARPCDRFDMHLPPRGVREEKCNLKHSSYIYAYKVIPQRLSKIRLVYEKGKEAEFQRSTTVGIPHRTNAPKRVLHASLEASPTEPISCRQRHTSHHTSGPKRGKDLSPPSARQVGATNSE